MDHPYQGEPYPEVGIACRQAGSQHDLLVAEIQEGGLVEELAYLLRILVSKAQESEFENEHLPGGKLGMPGGGAKPGGRPCGSGGMPVERQYP